MLTATCTSGSIELTVIAHRIQRESLWTIKAVWFLENIYHICLNFKGEKVTLTPLERDAAKKRKKTKKTYCRWLK